MTYSIGGARVTVGDVESIISRAREWASRNESEILLADARGVFGRDHLESAVRHGLRAESAGTMVARSVSMETIRYLAAQRQVADALRVAGIRRGTGRMAIVVFGTGSVNDVVAEFGWTRDDSVLDALGKDLEALGVGSGEQETVPSDRVQDLALERLALVDVEK
ncbi:MAG TPA: KEOPS complex subunit Cgi121 [Thermoplasmata archaeon]|nr:KEOPS complex subunit Cgi121 [Thermoplasmata archaeon]